MDGLPPTNDFEGGSWISRVGTNQAHTHLLNETCKLLLWLVEE